MSNLFKPPAAMPPPPQAPPVPPLAMMPDKRPAKKAQTPTFLGAEQTPQFAAASGGGGKTLLGQ